MPIPIPWYIKIPLAMLLNQLLTYLIKKGVNADVVEKIREVLVFLGLLGHADLSHDEMAGRFERVHPHCSGVACPPDLKG